MRKTGLPSDPIVTDNMCNGAKDMLAFCNSPWIYVGRKLPKPGKKVLVAIYTGSPSSMVPGYAITTGYYSKETRMLSNGIFPTWEERKQGRWVMDGNLSLSSDNNLAPYGTSRAFMEEYTPDFWMPIPPIK
jgi:hypothetical protein